MTTNETKDFPIEIPPVARIATDQLTMKVTAPDPVGQLNQTELHRQFRTGLHDILGSAKLLELQATETEREHIQRILTTSRDLLGLIEQGPTTSEGGVSTAQTPLSQAPIGRCDVLYVEDNDANFCLVRRILQRLPNVSLARAARGEMAAPLACQCLPRLILLDLNLPDIPGTEVFARMRAQPQTSSTPIVVVSADATPSQIERLLAMGARNYLTKPFSVQRFLAVVQEILEEEAKVA